MPLATQDTAFRHFKVIGCVFNYVTHLMVMRYNGNRMPENGGQLVGRLAQDLSYLLGLG